MIKNICPRKKLLFSLILVGFHEKCFSLRRSKKTTTKNKSDAGHFLHVRSNEKQVSYLKWHNHTFFVATSNGDLTPTIPES